MQLHCKFCDFYVIILWSVEQMAFYVDRARSTLTIRNTHALQYSHLHIWYGSLCVSAATTNESRLSAVWPAGHTHCNQLMLIIALIQIQCEVRALLFIFLIPNPDTHVPKQYIK